ncbi:MAG: hypothetical protein GFH27_549301n281 [Chloroflexi bacterium AL-W]|nr:hypothetical protein [Chloroflexi bacterium AL-N1]NOK68475.1 hypothetical protein [Chloroflexi bacterium AL-N10]NOK74121.1 hypothetical protein [Chloroflexi bacterium AL-N5]NOK83088.1 hypothetical protein [Chloroflexi bacterium AL-W]NOK90611.1 hypothetical protein [Chloroflexi bacterium AL-N15]
MLLVYRLWKHITQQSAFTSAVQRDTSHPDLVGYSVVSTGVVVSTHEWLNETVAEEIADLESSVQEIFGVVSNHLLLWS